MNMHVRVSVALSLWCEQTSFMTLYGLSFPIKSYFIGGVQWRPMLMY